MFGSATFAPINNSPSQETIGWEFKQFLRKFEPDLWDVMMTAFMVVLHAKSTKRNY
jgi:hypothetical protein